MRNTTGTAPPFSWPSSSGRALGNRKSRETEMTTTTDTPSVPITVRASAGSVFRLPHVWDLDPRQAVSVLKASGIGVVGTAPSAQQTLDQWDWRKPSAIVIGNEGGGLSEEEMNLCDVLLRIPQASGVESLNSAIAAAVILYEASKQRMSR